MRYAFTSALATVGGTFLLVWLPTSIGGLPAEPLRPVERRAGWLAAGAVATVFLLVFFGPGIHL